MKLRLLEFFNDLIIEMNLVDNIFEVVIITLIVLLITIIFQKIIKKVILYKVKKIIDKSEFKWDNQLYDRKVFQHASHIIPAILIIILASFLSPSLGKITRIIGSTYLVIVLILLINAALNALSDILRSHPKLRRIPVNTYIQVAKVILFIFLGVLFFGDMILDESFVVAFVGGLGGISAISLIVFKDTITGFFSGIALTLNEMVNVGDWISVPQHNADGEVIDMTLNTVKVKNWDNSITTIPPYSLLTDSFINWNNMQKANARRIKRSIFIDISSIKICSEDLINKLINTDGLKEYITKQDFNNDYCNITNAGYFRKYIENYLKNHPKIRNDLTCMVRQLQPTNSGVPLEIYAFTNTTVWTEYETIQADIMDHIFSIVYIFELNLFQSPTGRDLSNIK